MKFVYFIRHGEGYHNLMNYNYHNWHLLYPRLTTKGINQCYKVKETIESDKFDLIIVSPLRRTLETAEYIFSKNNNFIANDNIREFVSNPCDYRETVSEISKSFDYVNFQLINDHDNINQKETEDDILEKWILNNAWVESVNFSDLDYENDDLSTIEMTIRFDWAELETQDADGTINSYFKPQAS